MLFLSWLQYTAIFCSRDDSWIVLSTPDCLCGASEMCHAGMEYVEWDVVLVLRFNKAVKINQNIQVL